jgi:hypothetical protein
VKDCFKMLEGWWMPSEGLKGGLPIRGLRLRFTNERTNSSEFYLHSGRDNSTTQPPASVMSQFEFWAMSESPPPFPLLCAGVVGTTVWMNSMPLNVSDKYIRSSSAPASGPETVCLGSAQ